MAKKVLIMGAAGRDFHNFNTFFRGNKDYEVVAFTAFQIPGIAGRTYPPELAGSLYPKGIPIHDESELVDLIKKHDVEQVIFSYSDVSHNDVMHRCSIVNAAGADFRILGADRGMIKAEKPVISICAVRTGCGKSQTTRRVAKILRDKGKKVVAIRHPMPYGKDLNAQRCMRFASIADMDKHDCTIEEREEFEFHTERGLVVYAGVDYADILKEAEKEADIILWDGGNNDAPFYKPDLHIVIVDPHRAGHETLYHPGETNLRMADVIVVNKVGTASAENIEAVTKAAKKANPGAVIIKTDSKVTAEDGAAIKGKKVLVVEDGPTLTHGEMTFGAGHVAAKAHGAAAIVDPRPFAVGSIKDTFEKYGHVKEVLPAMGYGDKQLSELQQTIDDTPCDLVLVGTPFDLGRILKSKHPMMRVTYEMDDAGTTAMEKVLDDFLKKA